MQYQIWSWKYFVRYALIVISDTITMMLQIWLIISSPIVKVFPVFYRSWWKKRQDKILCSVEKIKIIVQFHNLILVLHR